MKINTNKENLQAVIGKGMSCKECGRNLFINLESGLLCPYCQEKFRRELRK